MEFVPCIVGSFQVFTGVSPNRVALESDVTLEAELTKHSKKGLLVVVSPIEGLVELAPAVPSFLRSAGAGLPKEWLGVGEGSLEVGLRFDLQVVTLVEHDPDVAALALAGHPHGIPNPVDIKISMWIENDAKTRSLGLVSDFLNKGDCLIIIYFL